MEFMELIASRYSVRSFSAKKIEEEKINILLKAASLAPTACNNQPQKLYVCNSVEAMDKLKNVSKFVFGAQTAIIFTADGNLVWRNPFSSDYHTGEIDCSIVCTHVMLQAWELGIGSCWIGYFDPDKIKTAFSLPDPEQVVAILLLGYPSENSKPSAGHNLCRSMEEMVKYL